MKGSARLLSLKKPQCIPFGSKIRVLNACERVSQSDLGVSNLFYSIQCIPYFPSRGLFPGFDRPRRPQHGQHISRATACSRGASAACRNLFVCAASSPVSCGSGGVDHVDPGGGAPAARWRHEGGRLKSPMASAARRQPRDAADAEAPAAARRLCSSGGGGGHSGSRAAASMACGHACGRQAGRKIASTSAREQGEAAATHPMHGPASPPRPSAWL